MTYLLNLTFLRQNNAKYVLCRAVCRIHLGVVLMCRPCLESRLSSMIQVLFDCVQWSRNIAMFCSLFLALDRLSTPIYSTNNTPLPVFNVHVNNNNKCKKTVVYLQLITAKWHIENSKNNERWYYFRSTSPVSTCF